MKTINVGGVTVFEVENNDSEQEILEFVVSLRESHIPFPFGFIACQGSTVIFENENQLDEFIDGWSDGVAVDA